MRAMLVSAASVLVTPLAVGGANAAVSFPPAGSNSFIALYEIDSGHEVCNPQCVLVSSSGRDATLVPTFFDGPGPTGITAGGSVSPTAMRGFVTSSPFDAVTLDLAFRDTYTVMGGSGPFEITARMSIDGVVSGVPIGAGFFQASAASLSGRIGTFQIDPSGLIPTVAAFPGASAISPIVSRVQTSDFTVPIAFDVTYTRTVNPGEVFDLAWMVSAAYANGEIDFQNTAAISFDTPDGVFLNAASGARFGDIPTAAVPEPSAWALMILGFGLGGAALRRRRSGVVAA